MTCHRAVILVSSPSRIPPTMSFRNLVGSGADCDSSGNPLMGMVKQFSNDKSHQQQQWQSLNEPSSSQIVGFFDFLIICLG